MKNMQRLKKRDFGFMTLLSLFLLLSMSTLTLSAKTNHRQCATATSYYINDRLGDDGNSGTGPEQAWKTLNNISMTSFQAGDSILLKAGGIWNGQMAPKGSGSAGMPIVLSKYGDGPKPIIHGEGRSFVLFLGNQEYWQIKDLEITNFNAEQPTTMKRGLWIKATDFGVVHHLHLLDLYLHDVNGNLDPGDASPSKDNGGIFFEITGSSKPTWFDDILIENCRLDRVSRTGICNKSSWEGRTLTQNTIWYPSRNVVIRNNVIERTGGNGLIWRVSHRPLVEHNLFNECAVALSGNAMFFFNCDSALAQYNEACYTVYKPGETDAAGFDADYRCKHTILQYNYSHDNGQGAFVVCTNGSSSTAFQDGATIRYNICHNNEREGFHLSGPLTDTRIYNNVVYLGAEKSAVKIIYHKSWGGYPKNTTYSNNIFYIRAADCSYSFGSSSGNVFANNVFFGFHPDTEPFDANKLTDDPLFENPGTAGMGWESVYGYRLRPESPCINSGVKSTDHPLRDYWGNPVPDDGGRVDRGAHEYGENSSKVGRSERSTLGAFQFLQNTPNPFNFRTTIFYRMEDNQVMEACIYNLQGERVKLLVAQKRMPAMGVLHWNGEDDLGQAVPSGVYYCSLTIGENRDLLKMLHLR